MARLQPLLLALFLTSWIAQGIFQWFEIANEAQAHGQEGTIAEFIPAFFSANFENWQSEFLQLFTMVVLTAFLIHRGSHESKDQDEKVDQTLGRIERRLEQLEQGLRPGVREEPHESLRPTPMLSGSGATPVSSAL